MDEQQGRIARVIEEYDSQGWHRTGTAIDAMSAQWLAGLAGSSGLEAALESYSLDRLDPLEAVLEVEGLPVHGMPLFDGGLTGPQGVSGRIGPAGSESEIGLAVLEGPAAIQQFEALRAEGAHAAIVAVTVGRRHGLQARNATHFVSPFGPPVLQVGDELRDWLHRQAERAVKARVVASAKRTAAESGNVVARFEGTASDLEPVIVTTPRSGWWNCAGERGGGIGCWLEVARIVAATGPPRPVWFVAFSGHELGHLGLDAFLARRPELVQRARAWVHFGANVGGAVEAGIRIGASTADFLSMARAALEKEGASEAGAAPVGTVPGLEPQAIHAQGGQCISLLGGNAFFHLQNDRWPVAVDVASVALQARAFSNLVLGLASC